MGRPTLPPHWTPSGTQMRQSEPAPRAVMLSMMYLVAWPTVKFLIGRASSMPAMHNISSVCASDIGDPDFASTWVIPRRPHVVPDRCDDCMRATDILPTSLAVLDHLAGGSNMATRGRQALTQLPRCISRHPAIAVAERWSGVSLVGTSCWSGNTGLINTGCGAQQITPSQSLPQCMARQILISGVALLCSGVPSQARIVLCPILSDEGRLKDTVLMQNHSVAFGKIFPCPLLR